MAVEVHFAGYAFHATGVPLFGISSQYESDENGRPTVVRRTVSIKQVFEEDRFADNEARIAQLKAALMAGEGNLRIVDELGGEILDVTARPVSDDVPQEWRQNIAEVNVVFQFRETLTAAAANATFTPLGGTPITLPQIRRWNESVNASRPYAQRNNRSETIVSISASGQKMLASSGSAAERLAEAQAFEKKIRSLDCKQGTLTRGTESQVVRIETAQASAGDASDRVEWSFTASLVRFPSGDYAEADYDVDTTTDADSKETIVTVRGTIKAASKSRAEQKALEIRSQYASGAHQRVNEFRDRWVDGGDGKEWCEASFTYEFRRAASGVSYTLKVTTRVDSRTSDKVISYEGSVRGSSASSCLSKARSVGLGKHPFMVSSSESVSTSQTDSEAEQFVSVDFTYEYLAKGTTVYAEVTRETARATIGEHRFVVSGFVSAATESAALSMINSYREAGLFPTEDRVSSGTRILGGDSQLIRVDFSLSYALTHVGVALSYSKEISDDAMSMEKTTTYSGSAYGESASACSGAVINLVGGLSTAKKSTLTEVNETSASQQRFVRLDFSVTKAEKSAYNGLLEAESSLEEIASISRASISPIPFGSPHIQTGVGQSIGVRTATGSATATTEGAARSFGQSKRSQVSGGAEDPPIERLTELYRPLSGSGPYAYRFEWTYSARLAG